jgi:hypothetical protein
MVLDKAPRGDPNFSLPARRVSGKAVAGGYRAEPSTPEEESLVMLSELTI